MAPPVSSGRHSHPQPNPVEPVWLNGATGFIGVNLQRALLAQGFPVRAYVRPGSKHSQRLLPACEAVHADLLDADALVRSLQGTAAVIYGAGAVRGRSLEDFYTANVQGITVLCKALASMQQPPPLLLISSLAASEPDLSHYANSKAQGEAVLRASSLTNWTILRPPAVYGVGDVEMRPIFDLMRKGWVLRPGTTQQRIALLNVADLTGAILAWLTEPALCFGATFALDDGFSGAAGPAYSWPEMAAAMGVKRVRQIGVPQGLLAALGQINLFLSGLFGYAPMLSPGKARELQHERWMCDNSRFTELTAWRPKVTLGQGVRELFEGSAP